MIKMYQELIDVGFEEAELEELIGRGMTIEEIHQEAIEAGYFDK